MTMAQYGDACTATRHKIGRGSVDAFFETVAPRRDYQPQSSGRSTGSIRTTGL